MSDGKDKHIQNAILEVISRLQYGDISTATNILNRVIEKEVATKQAKIDSLMLEYCPNEMTEKQIKNWEKHQKPANNV